MFLSPSHNSTKLLSAVRQHVTVEPPGHEVGDCVGAGVLGLEVGSGVDGDELGRAVRTKVGDAVPQGAVWFTMRRKTKNVEVGLPTRIL